MTGEDIVSQYVAWVRDNSFTRGIASPHAHTVLTTPFLDSHNDHIDIYIGQGEGNTLILSDDGYTVSDLLMSGTNIFSTPRRKKTFETTLNRYNAAYDEGTRSIYVSANTSNISQKKHNLLQCIIAVSDLYVISRENVISYFKEDLEVFLRSNNIIFSRSLKLQGKTGFDHNIDFMVPASRTRPERLVQAVNSPKKDQIMSALFSFNDIASIRDVDIEPIVIYNDEQSTLSAESKNALEEYSVRTLAWSGKQEILQELQLV